MKFALKVNERLRIRIRSGVAEETLTQYLRDPAGVRDASARRIEDAARAESISLPDRTTQPAHTSA